MDLTESSTKTEVICGIELSEENPSPQRASSKSPLGTSDMDSETVSQWMQDVTHSLNENEKTLLKRVLLKHRNLMDTPSSWDPKMIEDSFRVLSGLLVMLANTTSSTMNRESKEKMDIHVSLLEVYKFDGPFLSILKEAISKAWERHLGAKTVEEGDRKLDAEIRELDAQLQELNAQVQELNDKILELNAKMQEKRSEAQAIIEKNESPIFLI